mmetsp:Transcript_11279/g.10908  ORF Transcript_11279/g.10908 Transcript_11279/m.10908 type:complete len:116 (-) Transcript_11279:74-421(-)
MSNTSEAVKPPVNVNEVKSDGRDSRLQRTRKNNEEVLRKKMQIEAQETCASKFTAFGACAKEHSLMVIFNCRKENREMSDCMETNCSAKKFEEYLTTHGMPLPLPVAPWYQKYIS